MLNGYKFVTLPNERKSGNIKIVPFVVEHWPSIKHACVLHA